MPRLDHLLAKNRAWAEQTHAADPDFFRRLAAQQRPRYLWIGCSDSRVPANEIVGLAPGELFVHRNGANVVVRTDLNGLSVLQYAVAVLRVEHVIVTGHYGCGGVAALDERPHGLIENGLRHMQDVRERHRAEVDALPTGEARVRRLCELNVAEQVRNVARTTVVEQAWADGFDVKLHGWIYALDDGLLRPLAGPVRNRADLARL